MDDEIPDLGDFIIHNVSDGRSPGPDQLVMSLVVKRAQASSQNTSA